VVDFKMGKAPRIGRNLPDAAVNQPFDVTIVLLQVVWPEE
jgi:hypothetical protein